MAVRNAGRFLEPALESLARQDFTDFEVILVDNGSSDGSEKLLSTWAARDPRFRLHHLARPGLSRALSYAATLARAPILARLDADDIAAPHRFSTQHAWLAKHPDVGLLGSCADVIDGHGGVIGSLDMLREDAALRAFLRKGNPFIHSSIMMRGSAYEKAGGYRVGLRLCEDFDLWSRIADVTKLANLEDRLVSYRVHQSAMSAARPVRMAIADTCVVAARHARRNKLPEPFDRGVPVTRAALKILNAPRADFKYAVLKATVAAARNALAQGDAALARRLRRRALRLLWGLSPRNLVRGLARVIASYFPAHARMRRKVG